MSLIKTLFFRLFFFLVLICFYAFTEAEPQRHLLESGISQHVSGIASDSVRVVQQIFGADTLLKRKASSEAKKRFYQKIQQTIEFARKTGHLSAAGYAVNKLGERFRNEAKYSMAIWLHKKAIDIAKETGNNKLLIFSYNDLGVVYRRIDSYQKAMEYHLKALKLAAQTGDSVSRAMAVNSIGNVYVMLGDFNQALNYFRQSLRLEQNRNNPIGIAINLNNIGHVYEEKGNLARAFQYYKLSLAINQRIGSKRGVAICSNDIAGVLIKEKKYREALQFSKKALQITREVKDYDNMAYAYIKTGTAYSALKEYTQAFRYLLPGIELAKKIRARAILEEGYAVLFKTYMAMKNYKKAIASLKLKNAYHDSLINLDVKKNIARLQIQFDTERQKSQMQLEKQKTRIAILQLKKQKYLLYFTWSAFAILLIVLAFVIFYLFNKEKQNKLLREKTKEIERAEKELKKSNQALQKAIRKAEESARAKTDFLANISHEIRTPLNSVIGFSDLLYSMTTDEKQKNYLRTIKSSGESLLALINDILNLSKIEDGNISLEYKETDPRKILREVSEIFSMEASNKGLHLYAETDENVPPTIIFDEARLRQILLNLVGNAIKFTERGSVKVHASVTNEKDQDQTVTLIIDVEDTGQGISPEEQENIFEPFHQAETRQKSEGVGLGLAITRRMIQAMNGEIQLESQPGKGSRFTILFYGVKKVDGHVVKLSEQKMIHTEEQMKCMFISELHPLKETAIKTFTENGYLVEDVGLNLTWARKNLEEYRMVVFCCLQEDILKNTLNIFEKENLDNRYCFIILNINKEPAFNIAHSDVLSLHDKNISQIKETLNAYLRKLKEYDKAVKLFEPLSVQTDALLFQEIQQIYQKEFSEAYQTKMFDKINDFTEKILHFAVKNKLFNLENFATELNVYAKNFDIVLIENQMRIFQQAYDLIFHRK